MHRLTKALSDAAAGRFPPQDGLVEVTGPPPGRAQAIVSFSAHAIVATALSHALVDRLMPRGDLSAPLHAETLCEAGRLLGMRPGTVDVVLVAVGPAGDHGLLLRADERLLASERVRRSLRYRDNVTVWTDDTGRAEVTLGQGLAGRWEVSLELEADLRGQALGSMVLQGARGLVAPDVPLWAQVAPGNAVSLRAFLAAGFTPVGAEVLFLPGGEPDAP